MTNSIGYANPAGTNLGTIALEKLRNTPEEKRLAANGLVRYIRSGYEKGRPIDAWERLKLASMLGLNVTPPHSGKE